MKKYLMILPALAALLALGCATVPEGADEVQFRLREAQLNLDTASQAIPLTAFSESDQKFLLDVTEKAQALVKVAQAATGQGGAVMALRTGLPALQALVDAQPEGKAKTNAQRIVAVLDVTLQIISNQEQLRQEFSSPPAAPAPAN